MKVALQQAEIAYGAREIPVGAVITCENQIIAKAHNQVETLNDSTAHAEVLALTSAFSYFGAKYLPDCTLYVSLEPCVMCAGAIYWSQIAKVVIGAADEKRGYSKYGIPFHSKTTVVRGVMENEASAIMTKFFKSLRN